MNYRKRFRYSGEAIALGLDANRAIIYRHKLDSLLSDNKVMATELVRCESQIRSARAEIARLRRHVRQLQERLQCSTNSTTKT